MTESSDLSSCKLILDQVLNRCLNIETKSLKASCIDNSSAKELIILDENLLRELLQHLNTISCFKFLHTLPEDDLIRVILVLDFNVKSVLSYSEEDFVCKFDINSDAPDSSLPLFRGLDASVAVLKIMTCNNMPIKIFMEDLVQRIVNLIKTTNSKLVMPLVQASRQSERKKGAKRSRSNDLTVPIILQQVFSRIQDIVGSLTEMIRLNMLNESIISCLAQVGIDYFFSSSVHELQTQLIFLLGNIFVNIDEGLQVELMRTIMSYLCNPLICKKVWQAYESPSSICIEVELLIQIVQALASISKPISNEKSSPTTKDLNDFVSSRLRHAQRLLSYLFRFFLIGSEDDYRKSIFNNIVHDFLLLLDRPEYPVSTFFLTVLGRHLMELYKNKALDIAIRTYCLDLIGTIALHMSKTVDMSKRSSKTAIDEIESKIKNSLKGSKEKLNKTQRLQQSLIDYLAFSKDSCMIEFAMKYYASAWQYQIKHQLPDAERVKKNSKRKSEELPSSLRFLLALSNPKYIRKRVKVEPYLLSDDEAYIVARYVTTVGDAYLNCEPFINYIFHAITAELIPLRTKALKCLSHLVQNCSGILKKDFVANAIQERLIIDSNALVREATIEVVGIAVLKDYEFLDVYESQLLSRLQDTSLLVRKRVARVLKAICEQYPTSSKIPRFLYNMLCRIDDEKTLQVIVLDTFFARYFLHDQEEAYYVRSATELIAIAQCCTANEKVCTFEALLELMLSNYENAMNAIPNISERLIECLKPYRKNSSSDDPKSFIFSIICILCRFGMVMPEVLENHVDYVIWFLEYAIESNVQPAVVQDIVRSMERLIPYINTTQKSFYDRIHSAFQVLLYAKSKGLISFVTACLAELYRKQPSPDNPVLIEFLNSLALLNRIKKQFEEESNDPLPESIEIILRAFFSVGVYSRYFNFDIIFANDSKAQECLCLGYNFSANSQEDQPLRRFRDNTYGLLLFFASRGHPDFAVNALFSLGHLCVTYAEYVQSSAIHKLYIAILSADNRKLLSMKIQTLANIKLFLVSEEQKIRESKIEKDDNNEDDLKQMDLPENGVGSVFIQLFFKFILACYFNANGTLRKTSSEIVKIAICHGFVNPAVCASELIAMSLDSDEFIRNETIALLKEVNKKYPDCLIGKSAIGCLKAYELSCLKAADEKQVIRGFNEVSKENEIILTSSMSDYYQLFTSSKAHRRQFVNIMLSLFSESNAHKISTGQLVFLADNLIALPFEVLDEPLYVIKHIDGIVSLSGQNFLIYLKENVFPKNLSKEKEDDILFTEEVLLENFPKSEDLIRGLMDHGKVCIILMYMKNYLMGLYRLSDKRVQGYSASEPKLYLKPVNKKEVSLEEYNNAVSIFHSNVSEHNWKKMLACCICKFRSTLLALEPDEIGDL